MGIDVDPNWWKTLFDEIYLITDARSVCDEALTCREIDVICELLPMNASHRILDLCGGHGRHTFELCKRGFTECTLLDYSRALIDVAKARAVENNYSVDFIQCDARNTELPSETFDHVIIMGNSLGYIQEPEADIEILMEAYRVLRKGGIAAVEGIMAGTKEEARFPVFWADNPNISFMISPDIFRQMMNEIGYVELVWVDITEIVIEGNRIQQQSLLEAPTPIGHHILQKEVPRRAENTLLGYEDGTYVYISSVFKRLD